MMSSSVYGRVHGCFLWRGDGQVLLHWSTYSGRLLAEQADGDVSQCRVDQDSLGNVMEVSWNGGLSSRDLRFAVWQRCESRCLAAAVAHDLFSWRVFRV
jgi:hypothetical protein